MRALVVIPTLTRADLLRRNRQFLEGIRSPDLAVVVDNGNQNIGIRTSIHRPVPCLSVSGSLNYALRRAFVENRFDLCVLLNDDIIWDKGKLNYAKHLVRTRRDVDLFLWNLQFSVQVHRPSNIETIGYYDEQFPAYCNDDDYAIRVVKTGRVYERFDGLDPLPGSISEGTPKPIPWKEANQKLFEKWGASAFGINIPHAPYYKTNRGVKFP